MGCGESKNAVATANTISHRNKSNEEDAIIDREGEKESQNGQEGGHEDEEKAAKKEGDDGTGGDGEQRKESQGSLDQTLPSTDGIDGAVSEGLSGKSEDVSGSKISKVEVESAERKQVLEETETNQIGPEGVNNKEEEASSDLQPKASSPDDEEKEKA